MTSYKVIVYFIKIYQQSLNYFQSSHIKSAIHRLRLNLIQYVHTSAYSPATAWNNVMDIQGHKPFSPTTLLWYSLFDICTLNFRKNDKLFVVSCKIFICQDSFSVTDFCSCNPFTLISNELPKKRHRKQNKTYTPVFRIYQMFQKVVLLLEMR